VLWLAFVLLVLRLVLGFCFVVNGILCCDFLYFFGVGNGVGVV